MRGLKKDISEILHFPLLTSVCYVNLLKQLNLIVRNFITCVVMNIYFQDQVDQKWTTGINSLKYAFELESNVTRSIRSIIKNCEAAEDYHVSIISNKYLTI